MTGNAPSTPTSLHRSTAAHLVQHCGSVLPGERVLVVCDPGTREVAEVVHEAAAELTDAKLIEVPPFTMHGQEPSADVAAAMAAADVILGMTWFSMAHTRARSAATSRGSRYLSLPEYSLGLLEDEALRVDFHALAPRVRDLADRFTAATSINVRTAAGTDLTLDPTGRVGNCCPGFVRGPGELGSPPDIEANVSPVETASHGTIVVDGSIPCPTIGLLASPVVLEVADGSIVRWEAESAVQIELDRLFEKAGSPKARILAECGVGLNPAARLTGTMLTDEGAAGTLHLGFGSNATVGGVNEVPFHLDFVVRRPDLVVDGTTVLLDGEWVLP